MNTTKKIIDLPDITALSHFLSHAEIVFIADLHLSEDHPELLSAFNDFLTAISKNKNTQNLTNFYILGDWFNAWVGDDYIYDCDGKWLQPIIKQLKHIHNHGTSIHFCAGNRDFSLGQNFLDHFGGDLLKNISVIDHHGHSYRLEHGDLLCTDDRAYQNFRRIIRNPIVLGLLKRQPLSKRKAIASKLRTKSKQANAHKSEQIMDVNALAVNKALKQVDFLIHGHTHRPCIHYLAQEKTRYVLGDWRIKEVENTPQSNPTAKVEAVIGRLSNKGFELARLNLYV